MSDVIEALKGEAAYLFFQRMCKLATDGNETIIGKFNDIEMYFYPGSHFYDKCQEFDLRCQLRQLTK